MNVASCYTLWLSHWNQQSAVGSRGHCYMHTVNILFSRWHLTRGWLVKSANHIKRCWAVWAICGPVVTVPAGSCAHQNSLQNWDESGGSEMALAKTWCQIKRKIKVAAGSWPQNATLWVWLNVSFVVTWSWIATCSALWESNMEEVWHNIRSKWCNITGRLWKHIGAKKWRFTITRKIKGDSSEGSWPRNQGQAC